MADEHAIRCTLDAEMAVRGMTNPELQALTGISLPTIRRLRKNHFTAIDCRVLTLLCKVLDLRVEDLLQYDPSALLPDLKE
jgi:DNA-binding Xre family transcriptional regulator